MSSAKARFREQKNGNHGEKVLFQANTDDPDTCPVNAMLRIRARAQRLHRSPTAPIGVASHAGTVVLLHDAMIRKHIQTAARAVYHITSKTELARYSSHSSRVGACVRLHLAGKDPLFIQTRLRWRSNSFQLYLRNVAELAAQHNHAVTTTPFS